MYIYIMKCSSFYKIGYSKNPENRLKTVRTHNPLDVKIIATLKTDNYIELERELHDLFYNKRARGEWFELKEDDLLTLKIEYGFSFKVKIDSILEDVKHNKEVLSELKTIRIDNHKNDVIKSYFEEIFSCEIINNHMIKKVSLKYDNDIIIESINSLFFQGYEHNKAYNMLEKVCRNKKEALENPNKYFIKIINAIFCNYYKKCLTTKDNQYLERYLDVTQFDIDEIIKDVNSRKFRYKYDEFWNYINQNFVFVS